VPRVGLFWGGSITERRLAVSLVESIAGKCVDHGYSVVLLGGKDIRKEAERIAKNFSKAGFIVNAAGRASLTDTVAHLKGCASFIGTDSGLMHLALACGCPLPGSLARGMKRSGGRQAQGILCFQPGMIRQTGRFSGILLYQVPGSG